MEVFLDNSASTPLLPEVIEEMYTAMHLYYGNPSSIHKPGRIAKDYIEQSRKSIAEHFQASVGEIFFTSGGTESNNMIIHRSVLDLGVRHILYSSIEHPSVLQAIQYHRNTGKHIIPTDDLGEVDYNRLEQTLRSLVGEPTLVSIMHANNEIGTLNDLHRISAICKEYGALFHSDTTQTIGLEELRLDQLDIDFITASAHKFHGPKGIGFVYINQRNSIRPMILGGSQERNMRAGTENIAAIAGMRKALEISRTKQKKHRTHIHRLRTKLKSGLIEAIPNICFFGQQEENKFLVKILNVGFPKSNQTDLLNLQLDMHGIYASGGSACSSGVESRSPIIQMLDPTYRYVPIRFSFSILNTDQDIDFVLSTIQNLLKN